VLIEACSLNALPSVLIFEFTEQVRAGLGVDEAIGWEKAREL
jgi:hypothetical protein